MKAFITGLLLSTALSGVSFAADFSPISKVDAVTVYLQGADIVRLAKVELPQGEHRVILKDLPANIDPQSIRVEGLPRVAGSLAVVSVDTRNQFTGEVANDQQRLTIERAIQALMDERNALDTVISDTGYQRQFLLSMAEKPFTPQSSTDTLKSIDFTQISGLLELVGSRLAALAKTSQTAQLRQRDIDVATQALNSKLAALAPGQQFQTEVVINVEASEAVAADLRVSYRVNEAGWSPYYDAKLDLGTASQQSVVEVIQRAEVIQSTIETWDDVALTLSTARPSGATAAPELAEQEVAVIIAQPVAPAPTAEPMLRESDEAELAADSKLKQLAGGLAKPEQFTEANNAINLQKQAVVEIAGFQANYKIETRVSVDNSGQSKKVRINSAKQNAKLEVVAVPRLDPAAYLTVKYAMKGSGPQLAGPVNLYLQGTYVGQGQMPMLNPGEETKLGFGVDDQVKITRNETRRVSGEEGLLTASNVEERVWDISVENLHDVAMEVTLLDRVPFASHSDIEITEIAGMTKPTIRDFEKRRGVHAWSETLEPKAKAGIKVGYQISWPKTMQVGLVD